MSKPAAGNPLPNRIPAIEALRGLAALYVVAFHLQLVPTTGVQSPDFVAGFIGEGGSGVTLFFIISAFTLCLSSFHRAEEPRPLLRFYLRRGFRIVPLYLALLAVTVIWNWTHSGVLPNPLYLVACLLFVYNFIPRHGGGIVWASWTLGVEMVFYAFFPFIFSKVNSFRRSVLFFALTLGGALLLWLITGEDQRTFQVSIFRHLPALACGIVMFHAFKDWTNRPRWLPWALVAAGSFGHWLVWTHHGVDYGQAVAVHAVVLTVLALGLCLMPIGFFVNRVTQFCGEISYSMYLVHPLILFWMSPIFARLMRLPSGWGFFACLTVALAVIISVSILTYRFIEQPGIRLGSRLIKKYCVNAPAVLGEKARAVPAGLG